MSYHTTVLHHLSHVQRSAGGHPRHVMPALDWTDARGATRRARAGLVSAQDPLMRLSAPQDRAELHHIWHTGTSHTMQLCGHRHTDAFPSEHASSGAATSTRTECADLAAMHGERDSHSGHLWNAVVRIPLAMRPHPYRLCTATARRSRHPHREAQKLYIGRRHNILEEDHVEERTHERAASTARSADHP